jgi:methylmalonyl-CoA mutase, N-terminal domain
MNQKELKKLKDARKEYDDLVARSTAKVPEAKPESEYVTDSWIPVNRLYTPLDVADKDYLKDVGFPGEFPFTRGVFPSGYRTRAWNRRQVAGRGPADECNQLAKYLISQGQTAFALHAGTNADSKVPQDTDDPIYAGYAFRDTTKMDTLFDYEELIDGIDLNKFSWMAGEFPIDLAMFVVAAQKKGFDPKKLVATTAGKVRLISYPENKGNPWIDQVEYCTRELPNFNSLYIDVGNVKEAGTSAPQEIAWTIALGMDAIREVMKRGLTIDQFGSKIHFYHRMGMDVMEEAAKFRCLRRMWARMLKDYFGAKDPRSWRLRTHSQSYGPVFAAKQPLNNIIRGTIQGLGAVMGGVQSMAVDTFDEPLAMPSDFAKVLSLRTQQILEHESGLVNVVDPLGGSYYVEWLTDKLEEEAQKIVDKLEELGGACKIPASAHFMNLMRESAYRWQKELDTKKRIHVGVNEYIMAEDDPMQHYAPELIEYDHVAGWKKQIARLNKVRRERDNAAVERAKKELRDVFRSRENMMPVLIEAVKTYISSGEIMKLLVEVRGKQVGPQAEKYADRLVSEIELAVYDWY